MRASININIYIIIKMNKIIIILIESIIIGLIGLYLYKIVKLTFNFNDELLSDYLYQLIFFSLGILSNLLLNVF